MSPRSSPGEFVWLTSYEGHRTPYLYEEGVLRTSLSIHDVYGALDSSITSEPQVSGRL